MPKVFDKHKSHVCFDNKKTRHKFTHTESSHEHPKEHGCMSKNKTQEKLKKDHREHIGSLWLFLIFQMRESIEPEFACWTRRVIPYPAKQKKYRHTHHKYPRMIKWHLHEVKESHNLKVKR
jgi:hypothetical protein